MIKVDKYLLNHVCTEVEKQWKKLHKNMIYNADQMSFIFCKIYLALFSHKC